MPKLISPSDKTRTRYRSRLVLRQHFPLISPLIAVVFHRIFPLHSHILVMMGASGCTWLKHLSKEGGLIPWTLWFILYPGCSPAVYTRSNFLYVHTVTSHPGNHVWLLSVKLHGPRGVLSHPSYWPDCTVTQAALPDGRSFTPWKHPTPGYLLRRAMYTATPQDRISCLPKGLTKVLCHQTAEARWRRCYIAFLALYSTKITLRIHEYMYFK